METLELTKKYELMVIVDAKLTEDNKEAILKEATNIVSKEGGKIINSSVWQEKFKLTYPIKKCNEGTYYLINFESEGAGIDKMNSSLRLNEKILRYVIIKGE